MAEKAERAATRSGGRSKRRALRSGDLEAMLPGLRINLPLTEPLDPDQIEKIDGASLDILEEIGVVFRDPIAIEDWKRAGARVEGDLVRFDRYQIKELISTIPSRNTSSPGSTPQWTRNSGRLLQYGKKKFQLMAVSTKPASLVETP